MFVCEFCLDAHVFLHPGGRLRADLQTSEADLFSDMEPTYRAPPKTSTGMSTTNAITGNKVAGRNDDEENEKIRQDSSLV